MLTLIGLLFWLSVNAANIAYKVDDLSINNLSGDTSSANFKQINSGGQSAIGESNSSSFILKSGFLYYSETATSTPPPPPTTQYALTVSKSGSGSGVATSNPLGVDCGNSCSANFNDGEQITLTAIANNDSFLASWSGGGCSGTGTCTVTVNSNLTITVTFSLLGSGGGGPPPIGGGGGGGGGIGTYIGGIGGIQVPCIPPKGDINRDCRVNLIDLSVMAYWWERPLPPITVDLNRNGLIDMADFSVLVFYWTG